MPRKPIDFSNTYFYKIVCKDTNVKHVYVGHTTDFTRRKCNHKKACENMKDKGHHLYIYQVIRENGHWENWDMLNIETRCCENSLEAKRIEREYIEQLEADLNVMKRPVITTEEHTTYQKEWRERNRETIQEYQKHYSQEHQERLTEYKKKWREDNIEIIKENAKKKYIQNKAHILQKATERWENKREEINQQKREHYRNNRGKLLEQQRRVIECPCGVQFTQGHKSRHLKSKYHQNYEKSLSENND